MSARRRVLVSTLLGGAALGLVAAALWLAHGDSSADALRREGAAEREPAQAEREPALDRDDAPPSPLDPGRTAAPTAEEEVADLNQRRRDQLVRRLMEKDRRTIEANRDQSPAQRQARFEVELAGEVELLRELVEVADWQHDRLRGLLVAHRAAMSTLQGQRSGLSRDDYRGRRRAQLDETEESLFEIFSEEQLDALARLQVQGKVAIWYAPAIWRARDRHARHRAEDAALAGN